MSMKWNAPEALAGATEANNEAIQAFERTTTIERFGATPIDTAALRISRLVARLNINIDRAALLSGLIYGEAA